ncbi:hypothetical protein B0I72DRAFT_9370 [Yarrowia lipolytica]|jgi:hypothetical protein|uniref:YALI0C17875p n=2 Tax=Yarrowia lipolytica TaxID=4952 RepID=Q6CBK9_YARLI|nr:YALI0C17875p [Yarrowia lipolytica CLIB122]AOW03024.1 hypothetical protein YALI1_C25053g [Yarrowia lipolytica]KAB8283649.1 hypothetical protein BKA91DRAFT_11464 [Yarrowia lipolytica]KAE8168745.1 hypothetical protein BKA90DRAFT_9756 [Yarrowia lipolytica]KAJ8053570.1 hypothetical protein LXG23DRAFT_49785 [Yarrowia lipolytica]RDW23576.1 hypothetical protein B0I71DRAFT_11561 [Yarrowia lipolytica]|eukprot:XP_501953.1 YALI0C17875p [Yarrowia lipolytica CLIB122]
MSPALLILVLVALVSALAPPACLLACVGRETQKQTQCSSLNQIRCICRTLSSQIGSCLHELCSSHVHKAVDRFTGTCHEFGVTEAIQEEIVDGNMGHGGADMNYSSAFSSSADYGSTTRHEPDPSPTIMPSTTNEPTITPTAEVTAEATMGNTTTHQDFSHSSLVRGTTTTTTFLPTVRVTSYVETTETLAAVTVTPSPRVIATTRPSASNQALVLSSVSPVYILFCVIIIIYK